MREAYLEVREHPSVILDSVDERHNQIHVALYRKTKETYTCMTVGCVFELLRTTA